MLKPAVLYKEEIERASKNMFYSEDYMFYVGYPAADPIQVPDVPGDSNFQFASVDKDGHLVGFIAFNYNRPERSVDRWGLVSFDKGNIVLIRDLKQLLDKIINEWKIHRLEWRCIGGNPVKEHYDKFCLKHGGQILQLHDVMKDNAGNYHDDYIYEIIFDN